MNDQEKNVPGTSQEKVSLSLPQNDANHTNVPTRITVGYLFGHALELANLERGIGFTIWRWLFQPRLATQEFLYIDRTRYVKPFTLLALAITLITYITLQWLGMEKELSNNNAQLRQFPEYLRPAVQQSLDIVRQYFHVFLVVAIPVQALANQLIFRRSGIYYPEHLVIVTYLFAIQTLLSVLCVPLVVWKPNLFGNIVGILLPVYLLWAIQQSYQTKWYWAALALLVYLVLGSLIPGIVTMALVALFWLTT